MMGRNRQLLGQMGIDIWIPRPLHVYTEPKRMLWRDQAPVEQNLSIPQPLAAPVEVQPKVDTQIAHDHQLRVEAEQNQLHSRSEISRSSPECTAPEQVLVSAAKPLTALETPKQLLAIQQFSWQCLCYQEVAILLDAADLNEDTAGLWENIQKFTQSPTQMLMWPMPWDQLQDLRGMASYIEGFIDSVAAKPMRLLCLGEGSAFEHLVQQYQAEILPSLHDMMDTPSLKKCLWEAMRRTEHKD